MSHGRVICTTNHRNPHLITQLTVALWTESKTHVTWAFATKFYFSLCEVTLLAKWNIGSREITHLTSAGEKKKQFLHAILTLSKSHMWVWVFFCITISRGVLSDDIWTNWNLDGMRVVAKNEHDEDSLIAIHDLYQKLSVFDPNYLRATLNANN